MDTVGPADVVNAVDLVGVVDVVGMVDAVGVVDAVGMVDVADTDTVEVVDTVGRRRWQRHVHSGSGGHADQGEPGEMGNKHGSIVVTWHRTIPDFSDSDGNGCDIIIWKKSYDIR